MVIDVVTYCGEEWAFDLRYNILKNHVDEFIVCEANTTFSGLPKPYYFELIKDKYENVRYFRIPETFTDEEVAQAYQSPNTQGAAHWKTEFLQKEAIKKALTHLNDDDIVFIGDVDEIWELETRDWEWINDGGPTLQKLSLRVYTYWLNNRSSEEFAGPVVGEYKYFKDRCLNHIRTSTPKTKTVHGWHFTSMGGPVSLRKKLTDSYTHESYASPEVLDNLAYNIEQSKDFLGRDFEYRLDESEWPEFLMRNRENYKHLIK